MFFDDFSITHIKSPIIQSNDYYPFGLTFNSYQREDAVPQRYKFQSQEHIVDLNLDWYSFKWRNYQSDLGRFFNADPFSDFAPEWSPYRAFFNNPLIYVDPMGLFETKAEAKEYRKEHGIKGRIQKDKEGNWAINNRKNNASYFKDSSLDGVANVVGRGEDGVIKGVLVTPPNDNTASEVTSKVNDGISGAGAGMVQAGGSFRLTNGANNGSRFSPRHYSSGWTGGSRARITTYNMTKVGTNLGRGSMVGSVALGAYNINEANKRDGRTFGYHTQVATAQTAGGIAGGWAGAKAGAVAGAAVGVWFGGAGAVPGAIIGGIIGGVAGGWAGSELSGAAVESYHNSD